MIEKDTIRLLRECDSGIHMAVSAIDSVLDHVTDPSFKNALVRCKEEHCRLRSEIRSHLDRFGDEGKEPGAVAKGMSWFMINMKLAMDGSDSHIADMLTDGCNMGVKSLTTYLHQYKAADEASKNITKRLVALEEDLSVRMRPFL